MATKTARSELEARKARAETELEALRDQIRREEKVAGLRPDGHISSVEIRRRRLQIAFVASLVFVGLVLTTVANDVWDTLRRDTFLDPGLARIITLVAAGLFAVYVLDKEQHLKRLTRLGHDVEQLDMELAERVLQSAAIVEATMAVHEPVLVADVLEVFLRRAVQLLGAARASMGLLTDDGHFEPASVRNYGAVDGAPLLLEESLVLQVALSREPLLLNGPVPLDAAAAAGGSVSSALCVPVAHDGALLGVLTVGAAPGTRFDELELELLNRFAVDGAAALAHARRYEALLSLVDRGGGQLVSVSDELDYLASTIRETVAGLRIDGLDPRRRAALLDVINASAAHLPALSHELLTTT